MITSQPFSQNSIFGKGVCWFVSHLVASTLYLWYKKSSRRLRVSGQQPTGQLPPRSFPTEDNHHPDNYHL